MRSPALAIAWEFRQRHRSALVALASYALVLGIVRVLFLGPDAAELRNEGRLPANYTVDMRLNKDFSFGGGKQPLSFFVEVDNLFNRHNVIDVYSRTGQADDDGLRIGSGWTTEEEKQTWSHYNELYDHDPQNFSPPRTVRVGMELSF